MVEVGEDPVDFEITCELNIGRKLDGVGLETAKQTLMFYAECAVEDLGAEAVSSEEIVGQGVIRQIVGARWLRTPRISRRGELMLRPTIKPARDEMDAGAADVSAGLRG